MRALGLSWKGIHKESKKIGNVGPVIEYSTSKRSEFKFNIRFIMKICFLALFPHYGWAHG